MADCRAEKYPDAATLPIQLVPLPGPKQLQLKTRADGVGVAAAGGGTIASEGNPCGGTGGANWLGALGSARGAVTGLDAGNCAHNAA